MRTIPSNLQWMLYTGTYTVYVKFWIYYNEKKKKPEEFNEFIT